VIDSKITSLYFCYKCEDQQCLLQNIASKLNSNVPASFKVPVDRNNQNQPHTKEKRERKTADLHCIINTFEDTLALVVNKHVTDG
jgi:hypothetical protein